MSTTTDQRSILPTSVTVLFPRQDSGVPAADPTAYTVTLAGLALAESASPLAAFTGSHVIWSSCIAYWTGGGSAANNAELQTLANQIATDWYRWQLAPYDVALQGMVPWPPEGGHDLLFRHDGRNHCETRVQRGPWFDHVDALLAKGTYGSSTPGGANTWVSQVLSFITSTLNITNSTVNEYNTTHNHTGTTTHNYASTTTNNFAGINVFTGPTYFPIYNYAGSPFTIDITNWTIPAGNVRIRIASASEYIKLNSIAPGTTPSGRLLYLYNVGNYSIRIINEAAAEATATRRILTTDGNDFLLSPIEMVCLCYDAAIERWRVSEDTHKRLSKVDVLTEWVGDQDDVALAPDVELHVVSSSTEINWTGVTNGLDTLRHRVVNGGNDVIWLIDNSADSAVGNRFFLPRFRNYALWPAQEVILEYDASGNSGDGVWHIVGLLPTDPAPVTPSLVSEVCHDTDIATAGASGTWIGSTSWTDIAGATVTVVPTQATTYVVWGVFDINGNGSADVVFDAQGTNSAIDTYLGALAVDGTREAEFAVFRPAHPTQRATVAQVWVIVLAAGSHTLKLQGQREVGTGAAYYEIQTTITALAVPILTVEKRPIGIPGGTVGAAACETDPAGCCTDPTPPVVDTDCCPDDLWPATMYLHFSAGTGTCNCLDGEVLTVVWDGISWTGADAFCTDDVVDLAVTCGGDGKFYVTGTVGAIAIGGDLDSLSIDCVAYEVEWTGITATAGCVGSFSVSMSATP